MFGTKKADDSLRQELQALRGRVDALESANKRLELEWTETYDKVRRQMSRMAKRAAVDAKENGQDPEPDQGDTMDPVSRSIMLRRGMQRGTR